MIFLYALILWQTHTQLLPRGLEPRLREAILHPLYLPLEV